MDVLLRPGHGGDDPRHAARRAQGGRPDRVGRDDGTGAAYLVYLGLQALASAIRGGPDGLAGQGDGAGAARLHGRTAYRQGLISDLGNPKMAAFFTSLLPQFGSTDAGPSFWLVLYATAIQRLGDALRGSRVRRTIEAVTGTVLVALGLRLATERQPAL